MEKDTKKLFQITEAAHACGLSRSTLMRMEKKADKKMTAKAMLFSEAIVRGSDITKAAALASPLFSSLTIEFLIVGESSGALATMQMCIRDR